MHTKINEPFPSWLSTTKPLLFSFRYVKRSRMKAARVKGLKLSKPSKALQAKVILMVKSQRWCIYLDKKVVKVAIALIMGVSANTMKHFIKTRKLETGGLLKATQLEDFLLASRLQIIFITSLV